MFANIYNMAYWYLSYAVLAFVMLLICFRRVFFNDLNGRYLF